MSSLVILRDSKNMLIKYSSHINHVSVTLNLRFEYLNLEMLRTYNGYYVYIIDFYFYLSFLLN